MTSKALTSISMKVKTGKSSVDMEVFIVKGNEWVETGFPSNHFSFTLDPQAQTANSSSRRLAPDIRLAVATWDCHGDYQQSTTTHRSGRKLSDDWDPRTGLSTITHTLNILAVRTNST